MRRAARILLLALSTAALIAPRALVAGPKAPAAAPSTKASAGAAPSAKDKAAATKLLSEGNRLSGDGQYLEALEKFRAAYALYPSPKLLLNIGTMQRQLGRNVEAAATYEAYLLDPNADPKQTSALRRVLEEIDALVGHLQVRVNPSDAAVTLDGSALDAVTDGSASVRVEPGTHTLLGEKAGLPPAVKTISVRRGETLAVDLALIPMKPSIVVREEKMPLMRVVGYVVGGVGVLGLVGGGAAGVAAIAEKKRAASQCEVATARCDSQGIAAGAGALTAATISTASFVAGGALVAGGLALVFVSRPRRAEPSSPSESAPSVSFLVVPSGGMVSVGGVF